MDERTDGGGRCRRDPWWGGAGKKDASAGVSRTAPRQGAVAVLIVFSAHWQVDKGKDVELYHYGEAQEDGVEDQHIHPQLPVQLPLVQMDAEDLEGDRESVGLGEQRNTKGAFTGKSHTNDEPQHFLQNVDKNRGVLPGVSLV